MSSVTFFNKRGLVGCLGLVVAIAVGKGESVVAQSIILDTTLGSESSSLDPVVSTDIIRGGAIRGSNLFHSFQKFNIDARRAAFFESPEGIKNIVGRVTGNERSNILGTLGVLGEANLFLINPNGISFGPNARLSLGGSFMATTANAIQFGDRGFFGATNPEVPPAILTVDPSALLFNQISGKSITNRSLAGLQVRVGRSLLLVGGDVELTGGKLSAARGRIELAGVAGGGVVGLQTENNQPRLSIPDNVVRANISLSEEALVDVSLRPVTLKEINISDNVVRANVSLGQEALVNVPLLQGTSGEVSNSSGSIQVQGRYISVRDGSQMLATTFGENAAGTLTVNASESLQLSGTNADANKPSGLFTSTEGSGNAGDLIIQTPKLIVQNGALVSASTFGNGQGGKLFVDSQLIELSGISSKGNPSGLFTVAYNSIGSAGELTIQTGKLIVEGGAQVSASTFGNGQGRGGTLTVKASEFIQLAGTSANGQEGSGLRVGTSNSGDAGDLKIDTPKLVVQQGAIVSASTIGQGSGGNLTVKTGELIVQDGGRLRVSSEGGGKAGNIELTSRSINLSNQGTITTASKLGEGGNISLNARDILLSNNSSITASAGTAKAGGNGGNINIDTNLLVSYKNSNITANAFEGQGGNIRINTQGLFLSPDSVITADSELGIDGVVETNIPDFDPTSGLVNLPTAPPVDTQVAQACQPLKGQQQSEFTIAGRGGLPPNPGETLTPDAVQVDLVALKPETETYSLSSSTIATPTTIAEPIVEATEWVRNADGEVLLIASVSNTAPRSSWHLTQCGLIHSKNVEVRDFSLVVVADNQNPSILNPDFLKYSQIVPPDWELAMPPICTPPVSQVVFKNGIYRHA